MCISVDRSGGAVSEEGPDRDRHLRGSAGGGHRVRGGLLQNQVSVTVGTDPPPLHNWFI